MPEPKASGPTADDVQEVFRDIFSGGIYSRMTPGDREWAMDHAFKLVEQARAAQKAGRPLGSYIEAAREHVETVRKPYGGS